MKTDKQNESAPAPRSETPGAEPLSAKQFWLQLWPDENKQSHWSAKGLNVVEETLKFAEAYASQLRQELESARAEFNTLYERAHMLEKQLAAKDEALRYAHTYFIQSNSLTYEDREMLDEMWAALKESHSDI
jgi:hypothetical protein